MATINPLLDRVKMSYQRFFESINDIIEGHEKLKSLCNYLQNVTYQDSSQDQELFKGLKEILDSLIQEDYANIIACAKKELMQYCAAPEQLNNESVQNIEDTINSEIDRHKKKANPFIQKAENELLDRYEGKSDPVLFYLNAKKLESQNSIAVRIQSLENQISKEKEGKENQNQKKSPV